jgi:hypothetical protein
MKVKVHDCDIECPDKPWMVELVKAINPMQAWTLHRLQEQPKNWPGHENIPEYCIYMGSGDFKDEGKVDFYHYEPSPASFSKYSTAIVFGDFGGDYHSGWPELATKHDYYREHMKREFRCGFLTLDDLARVGVAALGIARESSDVVRSVRGTFRFGPEVEPLEDGGQDFGSIGDDIRKVMDDVSKAMGIPAKMMRPEV